MSIYAKMYVCVCFKIGHIFKKNVSYNFKDSTKIIENTLLQVMSIFII